MKAFPATSDPLDDALALHKQGRYEEALLAYDALVAGDPEDADAIHLGGVAAHQLGRYEEAAERIAQAIELDPQSAEFRVNLAESLRMSGKTLAALEQYRRAAELSPDLVVIWRNLGLIQQIHGAFPQAAGAWRRALELTPDDAEARNNYGVTLRSLGKVADAQEQFTLALQLRPDFIEAHENLARTALDQGEPQLAVEYAERLAAARPEEAGPHAFLAAILNHAAQPIEAMRAAREAIRIDASCAAAHFNLGLVFEGLRLFEGAAIAYARAAELEPDRFAPHINLGLALLAIGEMDRATAAFEAGSKLDEQNADCWYNLAIAHERAARYDAAVNAVQKALALDADAPRALTLLGALYLKQGKQVDAEALFRRALEIRPDFMEGWSNLGAMHGDGGNLPEAVAALREGLSHRPDAFSTGHVLLMYLNCLPDLPPDELFREHVRWAQRLRKALGPPFSAFTNDPSPDRPLRIGYVSPDFRGHSVAFFFTGLITSHDRAKVKVICYDTATCPDALTRQYRAAADEWHRVVRLPAAQFAEKVREDRIDILVDLAGHTAENSLPMFAHGAAPVQVSYLGYSNTTGLDNVHYRIVDELTDPEGPADALATERLVRVPGPFIAYMPGAHTREPGPLPAERNGYVTFTSFNMLNKVNQRVIDSWSALLQSVPGSKLLLKAIGLGDESRRDQYRRAFVERGIDPEQLELLARVPRHDDHMAVYDRCDIALDPFPYNGTTTTCEALWMGVPVVTQLGQRHAARVGASLLTAVGLSELVAPDTASYLELARALAADLPRLADLRRGLRARMLSSPLMDAPRLVRELETVYGEMWKSWCGSRRS